MTSLAWKNLVREKTRLAISVGGVAFAVVLILLVRGLYNGFQTQSTQWIRSVNADIWVAQAGTPGDLFHSVSLMRAKTGARIRRVAGVEKATPLIARSIVVTIRGKDRDFRLVGIDPADPIGVPPAVERGKRLPTAGELVVDRVFARNASVHLGDTLSLAGRGFRVVGIARGGNTIISQFAWAPLPDVERAFGMRGTANYFLVSASSRDAAPIAARIAREVPGTKPMLEAEFIDKNLADIREGFLPIVLVLVIVAFAIGTAVIGLTIYTATLEKRREYGVLKAVGVSNPRLYAIVSLQSLVSGAIGFALGVGITLLLGWGLEQALPSFVTSFTGSDFLLAGGATLLMSLLASFVPIRPVARLDPAEVFRV